MNLIMSDVQETIMIVEGLDDQIPGQKPTIRVKPFTLSYLISPLNFAFFTSNLKVAKRNFDMLFIRGDGVILVCRSPPTPSSSNAPSPHQVSPGTR